MQDILLQFDEMAIRKDTPWDQAQHKYVGHVDYGQGEVNGEAPLATTALVALASGISGGWKCPIGYLLTNHADSGIMVNFTVAATTRMASGGFNVHGIVIDGATGNVGMLKKLGLDESKVVLNESETILDIPGAKARAIYDVCHMVKLWRNLLFQNEIIWDGKLISFKFVRFLYELQADLFIRAANKLTLSHLKWESHKMKVKLAVQVLSSSVADAIDFCRLDLGLPEFKDSATTTFVRLLNDVFDVLNSRSWSGQGNKSPMTVKNYKEKENILLNAVAIFSNLKIYIAPRKQTKPIVLPRPKKLDLLINTCKKRPAVGLIVSIRSILAISKSLLTRSNQPFLYISTYRFSQDLLELLFGVVRSKLGTNNNPNVLEFKLILRKLWHHNMLVPVKTGNCEANGDVGIQGFLPLERKKKPPKTCYEEIIASFGYFNINPVINCSFYDNCLVYIAGAAISTILETMECPECAFALLDSAHDPISPDLKLLIKRKDRGGLHCPSSSVYQLVKMADSVFRSCIEKTSVVPTTKDLDLKICMLVLEASVSLELFPSLESHVHKMEFTRVNTTSHYVNLIRRVVKQFLKIRLYDYGKRYSRNMGVSERHSRNKLTLFRNE